MSEKRKSQAKLIRIFRKVHRTTGAFLFVFFFLIAVTGFLLGIKKHSGGVILPDTKIGSTTQLTKFLPLDSLQKNASRFLVDFLNQTKKIEIDRIDVRPEKGIVKFTFKQNKNR